MARHRGMSISKSKPASLDPELTNPRTQTSDTVAWYWSDGSETDRYEGYDASDLEIDEAGDFAT